MHVCLDVAYEEDQARAAAVAFADWQDGAPSATYVAIIGAAAPYVSGQFFERELPCLLAVLEKLDAPPETVVIDGYVRLDDAGRPGLGMHLHRRLGGQTAVIGVAKSPFAGLTCTAVLRGGSQRPLHITAAGMPEREAAERIAQMHGPRRLPTMIRLADRLSRGGPAE